MNAIIGIVAYPLGWIMWLLYSFIPNYGLVIIVFTLITKILLFPLSVSQHKSVISRTRLQPQMNELKVKYGKNHQKYQEEMMALYKKEGISPMSGCGSQLVQFPILFGIFGVVYAPLKYILHLPDDVIAKATKITNSLLKTDVVSKTASRTEQYNIITTLKNNSSAYSGLGQEVIDKISGLRFNFLGMDLSKMPYLPHNLRELDWLILIPILSGVTSLLFSIQSMKNTSSTAVDDASKQAVQSMKIMMFFMPLMSMYFSFKFPAGVGLYWIFSNLFLMLQNKILYAKYNPAEIIAKAKEEMLQKKEQERLERIAVRKSIAEGGSKGDDNDIYTGMSQKEINKIKLANARKRDAEKYGDYSD